MDEIRRERDEGLVCLLLLLLLLVPDEEITKKGN